MVRLVSGGGAVSALAEALHRLRTGHWPIGDPCGHADCEAP